MTKKVALIDKAPSKVDYTKYIEFEFDHFHMSDVPIKKLKKADVTLTFPAELYDLVILVGAEAAKEYAKVTSVTNMAGQLVQEKYVCISNPAMLIFKPEGKPDFKRAIDRLTRIHAGEAINSTAGEFRGICDTEEAKKYLQEILDNADMYVAWDTETTALYPRDGYVLGVSLTYKIGQGAYIITDCMDEECLELLQKISDKFIAVFHNLKFDWKMLEYHLGITFDKDRVHDTMLMHYALDENNSHSLKVLALKYTEYGDYDAELEEFKADYCKKHKIHKEDFTYDLIPYETMWPYAAIDTAVTFQLFLKFKPIIANNEKLQWVYENLLLEGTIFLMGMEEVGIPFDKQRLHSAEEYLDTSIEDARMAIYEFDEVRLLEEMQGEIFNPNSVIQIRKLLFDVVGLTPTGKKTDTGAISTDEEVLTELSEKHQLPAAILKVKKLIKLRNTYVSKLIPAINKDGRVRTNFNLIFTTSGRLSSSGKFNAQQIPRDDPIIKGCIVAPDGYVIVSQDLQTGEMYYASVLSGDKELQKVFRTGGDFHSAMAKSIFGLTCTVEEVKTLYADMRQSAKAISFGILYGSGAKSVAESVTKATGQYYSKEQAEEDIKTYFKKFHVLKKWLDSRAAFIKENGFTYSFFGRKRRLSNVFSSDKAIAAHEVRSGINAEIQSLCSDVNLLAAIGTQKECKEMGLDANIFMLVHDSIVALVRIDQVEEYKNILARHTQKDYGCSISNTPIGIDVDVGTSYSFGKYEKTYGLIEGKLARLPSGD